MSDPIRVKVRERRFPDDKELKVSGRSIKQLIDLYAETVNHNGYGACMSHQLAADMMQVGRDAARDTQKAAARCGFIVQIGELESSSGGGALPIWRIDVAKIEALPVIPNAWQITADAKRVTQVATPGSHTPASAKQRRGLTPRVKQGSHTPASINGGVSHPPLSGDISSPPKGGSDNLLKAETDVSARDERLGFQLSANAPRSAPMGRRSPKVGEAGRAREFWKALCETGVIADDKVRLSRCKPKLIDAALPPLLEVYGWDDTMAGAVWHYRKEGKFASGLQDLCEDGRLAAIVEEQRARRRNADVQANTAEDGAPCSLDEAVKRVRRKLWRDDWGDQDAPIYAQARAKIQTEGTNARM